MVLRAGNRHESVTSLAAAAVVGSSSRAHQQGPSAGLLLALRPPALQFAVHSVGVLAAAAGPVDPVVAALASLQAALDGRVAEQTGEEYRH